MSEEQGFGVFATEALPVGTIVWVRDPWDLVISEEIPPDLRSSVKHFAYVEGDGTVLMCWDHGRYVNHSCQPNALGLLPGLDIVVRPIEAGQQITDDYGTLGVFDSFPCRCGAPGCRGVVGPTAITEAMQAQFAAAMALVPTLPQALGKRARRWLDAEVRPNGHPVPGKKPQASPPLAMAGRLTLR